MDGIGAARIAASLVGTVAFMFATQASALNVSMALGQRCLNAQRLITYDEAVNNRETLCKKFGDWDIWRIADQGAMGGPGYKCTVHRTFNATPVGGVICTGDAAQAPVTREIVRQFAPEVRFAKEAVGYPMSAQPYFNAITKDASGYPVSMPGDAQFGPENLDKASLRTGAVPTYYQARTFGNQVRLNYWWFYGYQHACFQGQGTHNGDWEHVLVTLTQDRAAVAAVTYYQHDGWYTRVAGPRDAPCTPGGTGRCGGSHGFASSGAHPVVYVGKIAHGSYHDWRGSDYGNTSEREGFLQCAYYGDFRNPASEADYLQTSENLIDLDDDSDHPTETWRFADRWGPTVSPEPPSWLWGPDGVSTHPTRNAPVAQMAACDGFSTYRVKSDGCYMSECLSGDDQASENCLVECQPGYTNHGLTCWKSALHLYGRLQGDHWYRYDYTLPITDIGLSRRRSGYDEWPD